MRVKASKSRMLELRMELDKEIIGYIVTHGRPKYWVPRSAIKRLKKVFSYLQSWQCNTIIIWRPSFDGCGLSTTPRSTNALEIRPMPLYTLWYPIWQKLVENDYIFLSKMLKFLKKVFDGNYMKEGCIFTLIPNFGQLDQMLASYSWILLCRITLEPPIPIFLL